MSIMQQSSKAQDRALGVWFQNIQQGSIKLPRFQRFEAWDRARITSFLNTLINNLPVGVTLALEVAGEEKFESRFIVTAEPTKPGTVNQHLLDGQQRLTAFWRAIHDNYEWETFYVYLPQFDRRGEKPDAKIEIECVPRWLKKNDPKQRMPLWPDDAAECFSRGFIPVSLLRPDDIHTQIDEWINSATRSLKPTASDSDAFAKLEAYSAQRDAIKTAITILRERVKHFNLPYLSLPSETTKDVALQVFINMNTNSKPLTLYDIIVAEVENIAEKSLHDLEANLTEKCPKASRFGNVSDLILSTSALLQEKLPNTRGMIEMDKKQLLENWPKLELGLERMADLLDSQGIFDEARLPTNAVLAVLAAAYELIPNDGDFLAKAEKLLRRYLWSAFFTDRYENAAASRAFADFKAIKALLKNHTFTEAELETVPVLNHVDFPLADINSLMAAGWPKAAGIEARAILAVSHYLGATDFADHRPATFDSVQKREYHHVFPDALLSEAKIKSPLALNCALITKKTNRIIGRKDPLDYLQERVQWADEDTVRARLRSHLISFDMLATAKYTGLDGDALRPKLEEDFNHFLRDRATLVVAAMTQLTQGDSPTLEGLWTSHAAQIAAGKAEIES